MSRTGPDDAAGRPRGSPVGRRVVLGMLGLAAVGVAFGGRISGALGSLAERDPTGLTGLVPGAGGFRFYSVAGSVAPIPPADYRLSVDGLVQGRTEFTLADLSALPQTGMVKDVQCVTGWRVPDVEWSGVLLRDLLDHVGLDERAGAVEFGSSDGIYTESLTLDQALRDDVLIATGMQGGEVSPDHGGPVRLYVAPMYFYKSVKWLDRVTVTGRPEPGYWERRGYDADAWVGASNGRADEPT